MIFMTAYVIESPAKDPQGVKVGTYRLYVGTEARAQEIVAQGNDRTYRAIAYADLPEVAREKLLALEV